MSVNINGDKFTDFEDYLNDETKVSKEEKEQIYKTAYCIIQNLKNKNDKEKIKE